MNSTNRIALVTGAGTGIGKRTALLLWEAGFSVVLAGRRIEPLQQLVQEVDVPDSCTLVVPTDISDPQAVEALFAAIAAKFGRLDVLFNNAGVNIPTLPIEEITYEQLHKVFNTVVIGTFLCTQHAFRMMKSQNPRGGRIINNGSLSAQRPRLNTSAYSTAKHALNGLTKSTALDGRAFNIACGQIDIGNAETDMTSTMKEGVLQPNGKSIPEPTIDAEHIAQAVLYMATLPLDVNVPFMTVMATQMPFMGRG